MGHRRPTFLAFFLRWAKVQGWTVPLLHVRVCLWLETCTEPERVLMVFRGAAKSTIYAVYKAWRLYRDRAHRSLVWSADGQTAGMLTADVINVLRAHPWCGGMLPPRPGAKRFWVNGARDARNASMRANGVTSNATGARADAVDFDDIEVPGNIETIEARLKLRQRISESTHIAVPGAQKTYIGTPHTTDSIYPERIAGGAAVLKIPLFENVVRFKPDTTRTSFPFAFKPGPDGLYVITGIHNGARVLAEGVDYVVRNGQVITHRPPNTVVDICAGCAWPERFTRKEIEIRRKETRTLNAWDSQYQLEAKPLGNIRLDPERLIPYDCEPVLSQANGETIMLLGGVRIVGMAMRWDPSGGKTNSDVSATTAVLQDEDGRRYIHRVSRLLGDLVEFAEDGKTIIAGQVLQLCDQAKAVGAPRITVETNGIGGFAPKVLIGALKQRGLRNVGVQEETAVANKNKRILEALEPLLMSDGQLWAHVSVLGDLDKLDGPLPTQMRQWNPEVTTSQPDDYLDVVAGAVTETPERISRAIAPPEVPEPAKILAGADPQDWRPSAGVYQVEYEH